MMRKSGIIKLGLLAILVCLPRSTEAQTTINPATCSSTDVQTAINSAIEGSTVIIPAGNCSWTSGVSISGKGVTVRGAGSGRIVAYSVTSSGLPLTTGTLSLTISPTNVANVMPSLSVGQMLRVIELGFLANFMQGTVTSFNSSTGALVMNITNAGGTCGTLNSGGMNSNCKRWMISTAPSFAETVLINNLTSGGMFTVTEDTTVHTSISGIHFAQGASNNGGVHIFLNRNNTGSSNGYNSQGQAVLIHDNLFEMVTPEVIDSRTNRGVVWNNSFLGVPFRGGPSALRVADNGTAMPYSWSIPSTMGMADTNGEQNFYVETNDFEAVSQISDMDSNSRMVWRYNFLNNSFGVTHGADTSFFGMRHFEFYNNVGIWQAYTDGSTANPGNGWLFIRSGTFAFHDNTLAILSSQDWGNKSDLYLTVMSLQRQDTLPCWGAGTTPGQYYPAPRQIGFGYVTGLGKVTYPPLGYNNASTTNTGGVSTFVGDSEPAYIWNNSRTITLALTDYGLNNGATSCPASPTPDSTVNYFKSGRDYFNGTAKPGYTPYTYPHPLTLGSGSGTKPAPPTGLAAIVN